MKRALELVPPLVAVACFVLFVLACVPALLEAPTVCESGNALLGTKIAHGIRIYGDPARGATAFPYTPFYFVVLAVFEKLSDADPVRLGRAVSLGAVVLGLALAGRAAERDKVSRAVVLAGVFWVLAALWSIDMIALEAYPNALAATVALAAALAWQRGLDAGSRRAVVLGAALAVLACFTKQTFVWLPLVYLVATLRARGAGFARDALVAAVGAACLLAAVFVPLAGSHLIFYTLEMPGAQPRSLALVRENVVYGAPLLGSALLLSGVVALRRGFRRALADPRFQVALLAIATSVFFSSKIGSRGYALVAVPFLVLPWLLAAGDELDALRARWVERIPLVPLACLLAFAPASRRAMAALDSARARARWLSDVDAVVQKVPAPRRVWFSDAEACWTVARELTPEVFEVAVEATVARPAALDEFFDAFLARRFDVVVLSCAPEYDQGYALFERRLVAAGYEPLAVLASWRPRTLFEHGWPPPTRIYRRAR